MSVFQEFLNQEKSKTESGGFGNEVAYYKPKNPVIRLNKDKQEVYVRILPAVEQGSFAFAQPFRTTFINYVNKDGAQKGSGLTLPEEEGSSVLDKFITHWLANGIQFSRFPNRPGKRYFIHVIEYTATSEGLRPSLDQQGNYLVSPMEIPSTAYNAILGKLADQFLAPQGTDMSFISENDAFIVKIKKAKKGEMQWGVDVYPTQSLGALPANWRDFASDLKALVQPTEELNPTFVNFLINKVQNTDLNTDNFNFDRDANKLLANEPGVEVPTNPFAQAQQVPQTQGYSPQPNTAPQQDFGNIEDHLPPNMGGAPVQPSTPPQQAINPWETQQAPQQQVEQAPPAYTQVPQQQQQSSGIQWSNQPQQQAPQQQVPQQETPEQPTMEQPPSFEQPPSVDDVLKNLKLDM